MRPSLTSPRPAPSTSAVPPKYGGLELSVVEQFEVVSEVSKWDGSCGWAVWAGASTNWIPAGCGHASDRGGLRAEVGRSARCGHRATSRHPAVARRGSMVAGSSRAGRGRSPATRCGRRSQTSAASRMTATAPYLVAVQMPRREAEVPRRLEGCRDARNRKRLARCSPKTRCSCPTIAGSSSATS